MTESATNMIPDVAPTTGQLLAGRYLLRSLLGSGGMGSVFEAENTWTRRRVAVKVMHARQQVRHDATVRFLREAQTAARIGHENIVEVLDMGQDDATQLLYIVQEFLVGEDLGKRLEREGRIPPREALEIVIPIARALVAAHAKGIIHRDVKPENIYLSTPSPGVTVPKLIDFGISKIADDQAESMSVTSTGAMLGTPYYMSPEQARGSRVVGAQADVWAMGVVMFETLTGSVPFEGENYNAVIAEILTGPIPRLADYVAGVPAELSAIVQRALERDPARRFPTMASLLEALIALPVLQDNTWGQKLVAALPRVSEERAAQLTLDAPANWGAANHDASRKDAGPLVAAPATPRRTSFPTWIVAAGLVGAVVVGAGLAFHSRPRAEPTASPAPPHTTPAPPPPVQPAPVAPLVARIEAPSVVASAGAPTTPPVVPTPASNARTLVTTRARHTPASTTHASPTPTPAAAPTPVATHPTPPASTRGHLRGLDF